MSAADRHEAAVARRKANAIRQARAEEKRRLRTKKHGFHLSSYERESADFYATPPLLAAGLAIGLTRLGIALPQIALDPCGGNSALRRGLSPFGIELRLSDLYCEKYPGADGYVTHELLDAGHMESLRFAFELGWRRIADRSSRIARMKPARRWRSSRTWSRWWRKGASMSSRCCSRTFGVMRKGDSPCSTGRPSLAKSPLLAGSVDFEQQGQPRARLCVVRLAKRVAERPGAEGPRQRSRSDRRNDAALSREAA